MWFPSRAWSALVAVILIETTVGEVADPTAVQLDDEVCFEGFVMDFFCINRGTLLDDRSVTTLIGPDRHSAHCLLDIPSCRNSNFELLKEPAEGDVMYTRAFQLDDAGKALIIELGREAGSPRGIRFDCSTCTSGGTIQQGLRAEVNGVVTALAAGDGTPATLTVTSAAISNDMATVCGVAPPVIVPSPVGGEGGGDNGDDNETAIKVVSALSVAAIAILAIFSIFGHLFDKEQQM